MKIEIFTDGACSKNGSVDAVAGWAYVIIVDGEKVHEDSGRIENGTNNKGELQAVLSSLECILYNSQNAKIPIEVFSDSNYVIRGITEWLPNWRKNGYYRNKQKTDILANREYWKKLDKINQQLNVKWNWIKAHQDVGNFNDYVDKLAQAQTKHK